MNHPPPFWKTKLLSELSSKEWEMLCDGCGFCCLKKIVDDQTEETHYTAIACRLLEPQTCRCSDYANRKEIVSECIILSPENTEAMSFLPKTCAYRLVSEQKDLPSWHHLVCGKPALIHKKGCSVQNKVVSEEYIHPEDWEAFITEV